MLQIIQVCILYVNGNILLMDFPSFKFITVSDYFLPCWQILVFMSPLAPLEAFPCSVFVPQLKILFCSGAEAATVMSKYADIF